MLIATMKLSFKTLNEEAIDNKRFQK